MNGKAVDAYIAQLEIWQAEIVSEVRKIVLAAVPEAEEAIKWAQPVYSVNGPFAYNQGLQEFREFRFLARCGYR